jgi:hypothetical protein
MRTALIAVVAASTLASAAHAAPASVDVTLSPQMAAKAAHLYGVRDVDALAADLRREVTEQMARSTAFDGARIELVLADAVPNRPTFQQLGDTPGLSYQSRAIGGATIEGRIVAADGQVTPVHYRYYSASLRDVRTPSTWSDAQWTFGRFAYELRRGQVLASR